MGLRMDPQWHSTGQKVRLRSPEPADVPFVQALWRDEATMADVGGPIARTREEMSAWYRRMVDPGRPADLYLLICTLAGDPVGEVSLHRLDPKAMTAHLNIKVSHQLRGRGYASEALALFLALFFGRMGGHEMLDDLRPGNHAARALLGGFGFVPFGVAEPWRMRLTRDAYLTRRAAADAADRNGG